MHRVGKNLMKYLLLEFSFLLAEHMPASNHRALVTDSSANLEKKSPKFQRLL